jgi:DNA-binding XRE family transcriptional regulator
MTKKENIKELKEILKEMGKKIDNIYLKGKLDNLKDKNIDDIDAHNKMLERITNGENPIKVYREYRGLNRHELAEKSGTSYYNICAIEQKKRRGGIETLKRIAKALECKVDDLI